MPKTKMAIDHRFEHVAQQYERYRKASGEEKGRLLNEMATYTGTCIGARWSAR